MAAHMNNKPMKERIIRQVEIEINTLSEKRDELYNEIEKIEGRIASVEAEIAEARSLLVFMRTGKNVPVKADPPKSKRKSPKTDAEYRTAIKSFGTSEFTSKQLAEKLNVNQQAAQNKLKHLTEEGLVFVARRSEMTANGRTPAHYSLYNKSNKG